MEQTPLNEMTRKEIIQLINKKYPQIEDEVRIKYVIEKGKTVITDRPDEFMIWLRAIKSAKNDDIPAGTNQQYKVEFLNKIVNEFITPYIQQYQEPSRQWLEYYEIVVDLCVKWDIEQNEIGDRIKLPGKKFNLEDTIYNLK